MSATTHLLVDGKRLCGSDYVRAKETTDPAKVLCPRCRFLNWERERPLEDVQAFTALVEKVCADFRFEHRGKELPRHAWCDLLVKRLGGEKP